MRQSKRNENCKSVYIEITNVCNLQCLHCYNSSGADSSISIPLSTIEKVFDELAENAVSPSVTLSGGEPLCHPRIHEIISLAHDRKIALYIATNGILAEQLFPYMDTDSVFSGIQISLDGATAETNDTIRGNGHYAKVESILRRVQENGFRRVSVKMTVSKLNMHEVEEFFNFCLRYNVTPRYGFIARSGRAVQKWDHVGLCPTERMQVIQKCNMLYYFNKDKWTSHHGVSPYITPYPAICEVQKKTWVESPLIKPNGDVQPCQMLYGSQFTLGNIEKDNLYYIISPANPCVDQLKRQLCHRSECILSKNCSSCKLVSVCQGGCPAKGIDNGGFFEQDGDCQFRQNALSASLYKNLLPGKDICT